MKEKISKQISGQSSDHIITVNQSERFSLSPPSQSPHGKISSFSHRNLTEVVSGALYSLTVFPSRLYFTCIASLWFPWKGRSLKSRLHPLRYETHNATSLCLSRPLDVFFTLWMPSNAPDSVILCVERRDITH